MAVAVGLFAAVISQQRGKRVAAAPWVMLAPNTHCDRRVGFVGRPMQTTQHYENSSYREKLIEHLFVSELLKLSWLRHGCSLEVAKPEVDNAGYDLIAEANGIVRHIQLKTSVSTGSTASQKVHLRLAEKPSGCVLWIYFDEKTLALGPFRYFGESAGKPLPDLSEFKVGKHTKGNKDGVKAERQNIRVIPKGRFKVLSSIEDVYHQLFQIG